MNAGGVPNTCKSSGKALHRLFDPGKFSQGILPGSKETPRLENPSRIACVEYTSGGRLSNT